MDMQTRVTLAYLQCRGIRDVGNGKSERREHPHVRIERLRRRARHMRQLGLSALVVALTAVSVGFAVFIGS